MNPTTLVVAVLVFVGVEGKAHYGVHQVSPFYTQVLPMVYQPNYLDVFRYPTRGCSGLLGCLGQAINATNQGFQTGAQGILQGGVAAHEGIATGVGAAVGGIGSGLGTGIGGVASGTGQAIGGLASGTGQAIGGVASGTGQAVGGVASGTGQVVGGVASGTGQAIGGQATRPKKRKCFPTGPFSYICYYI